MKFYMFNHRFFFMSADSCEGTLPEQVSKLFLYVHGYFAEVGPKQSLEFSPRRLNFLQKGMTCNQESMDIAAIYRVCSFLLA